MELITLPVPQPAPGEVLVQTYFSAISAGTEGKTVIDARKGYLAKARARREEVQKVFKTMRQQGIRATYRMVQDRLQKLQGLGYSCSGQVLAVGSGVQSLTAGDMVACGGSAAAHAEVVCVTENLCVKLQPDTALDEAAFTTIGAIALQGIRRAELSLGENCAVIGLGLIGQLSLRLLGCAGVRTLGIDLHEYGVSTATRAGFDALLRDDAGLLQHAERVTSGHGFDAVIITAGTSSLDPVELAGQLCRNRGKVVIVGSVPTGFSRKNYYRKELELRMSTSYGPGRYEANYETHGLDYPIGQVRWTENRNMQSFADLIGSGRLKIKDLISHSFDFSDARQAFDLVAGGAEHRMGILLSYPQEEHILPSREWAPAASPVQAGAQLAAVDLIGAGRFASSFLLPHLKGRIALHGVATSRPHNAENARRKFGFEQVYPSAALLLEQSASAGVIIASRHDSHGSLVLQALKAGKQVYVEKPLCLSSEEYTEINRWVLTHPEAQLMVGFNRRFAPHTAAVKLALPQGPVAIHYRVNAGQLPSDHWVHDVRSGGGRILGEACHFVDLCIHLAGSALLSCSAAALPSGQRPADSFAATLHFANGSVASLSYLSQGSAALPKEYLEVHCEGQSWILDDFKSLQRYGARPSSTRLRAQDKGHRQEMHAFSASVLERKDLPVSAAASLHSTLATFALAESIAAGGATVDIAALGRLWS